MTSIGVGSYVQWPNGRGRVDLLVTGGAVPGVPAPAPDLPAARVAVWACRAGRWGPTGEHVAVKAADLELIPPPLPAADGADRLVAMLAAHDAFVEAAGLPGHARPTGTAVKQVYLRGLASWPGDAKTALHPQEWALERVNRFLTVAAGGELADYRRDRDLLPAGHPARASAEHSREREG